MNLPTSLLALSLVPAAAFVAVPTYVDDQGAEVSEVAGDVEIMRRVLAKELNRALSKVPARTAQANLKVQASPDELARLFEGAAEYDRAVNLLQGDGAAQYTSHTRGFYAPGIGAWFSTEVSTPVVALPFGEDEDAREGDAWDEVRREMRGGRRKAGLAQSLEPVRMGMSEAIVREAEEAAIEAIGRYGARIEGLRRGDDVVVALRFVPRGGASVYAYGKGGLYDLASQFRSGPVASSPRTVESATTVIRVPIEAVRRFAGGELDRDELDREIEITRY